MATVLELGIPSFTPGQEQFFNLAGDVASSRGLFGGAVEGAIRRGRRRALAGNRLSNLSGLLGSIQQATPFLGRLGVSAGIRSAAQLQEQLSAGQFLFGTGQFEDVLAGDISVALPTPFTGMLGFETLKATGGATANFGAASVMKARSFLRQAPTTQRTTAIGGQRTSSGSRAFVKQR